MPKKSPSASALVIVVCSIAIALFSSCSGKGSKDVIGIEETYPAAVRDLRVKSYTSTTATLEWTSPGEDDTVGTAELYDARYSTSEVTSENWDAALPVDAEPEPSPAGSTDTLLVTGLLENSTYYFGLKTRNHAGFWSSLSNCVNATCFEDIEVAFPDPPLEEVIRASIGKPAGAIYRSDLLPVLSLNANNRAITDLSGLEYCLNLETLLIWRNSVSDLSPLAGLVKMRTLQAVDNNISDITPLSELVNLEQLMLNNNSISDISAMTNMAKLSDVNLAANDVTSIAALAEKAAMAHLNLEQNGISDIGPLAGMTNLTSLNLYANQVTSVAPLAGMTKLTWLSLYANHVSDVGPLQGLTSLHELYLNDNQIVDIAPLAANMGLDGGDLLYLIGSPLSPESINTHIPALESRGVTVYR
jgi:hypothetical protein